MIKFKKILPILITSLLLASCSQGPKGETGPQGPKGDTGETGPKGETGDPGKDGVSILSIVYSGTSGLVDTYLIVYSDGTTSSFNVTNGKNGEQGIQGVKGDDGHTPTVEIGENGNWFVDGEDTLFSSRGLKGDIGDQGRSITKTEINEDGDLIVYYSDGTSDNVGHLKDYNFYTAKFYIDYDLVLTKNVKPNSKLEKPTPSEIGGYIIDNWFVEGYEDRPWAFDGYFADRVTDNVNLYASSHITRSLTLSKNSMTLSSGSSAELVAYTIPSGEPVTWVSNDETVATYDTSDNKVYAAQVNETKTCKITAIMGNLSASCTITVNPIGPGPDPGPVPSGWKGEITVGAPMGEMSFTKNLLNQFNVDTKSSVNFSVIQWEIYNGADNLPQVLSDGPDIYPFTSDQIISFYQRNALATLPNSSLTFINDEMGEEALSYARLNGTTKVLGYPFASDNGYVMFYSKSLANQCGIVDMNKISMDHLLRIAKAKGLEVNFPITNGYYAAGSLMSYSNGESLYRLKMKSGSTSYTVTSTFNSDPGVKAAKQIRNLFNDDYKDALYTATACPGKSRGILATIVDCSKVSAYKLELGSDYGVAPLPFIDYSEDSPRYANYLSYRFYGINPGRAVGHTDLANAVAKYLVSEYAQQERFNEFLYKPTNLSLLAKDEIKNEPHIKALIAQDTDAAGNPQKNTIALTAVDASLWNQAAVCVKSLKALPSNATDNQYSAILQELDDAVYVG